MATKIPPYGTPEYREYRQANRYGMTVSQLREKLKSQNYQCLICEKDLQGLKFSVDHDPECCDPSSKKNACGKCNRGILCHRCNIMVGHIELAHYENVYKKIERYLFGGL